MIKHKAIIGLSALLLTFSSCIKEEVLTASRDSEQNVVISFTTGTSFNVANEGVVADRYINSLRILGYKTSTSELAFNIPVYGLPEATPSTPETAKETHSGTITVKTGNFTVIFVANEHSDAATSSLLAGITKNENNTLGYLHKASFSHTAFAANKDIPMIAVRKNIAIYGDNKLLDPSIQASPITQWPISMERLGTRIDLRLAFENETVCQKWLQNKTISFDNVPDKVYLFAGYDNTSNTTTKEYEFPAIEAESDTKTYDLGRIIMPENYFTPNTSSEKAIVLKINADYERSCKVVSSIDEHGYTLPRNTFITTTATVAPAVDINWEAEVNEWSDGQLGEIKIDGSYMLGVNKTEFALSGSGINADEDINKLVLVTNYINSLPDEKNLKAEFSASETEVVPFKADDIWIGFGSDKSQTAESDNTSTIKYLYCSANTNDDPRTAYIHAKAGNMKIVITITQSAHQDVTLEILKGGQPFNGKTLTFYENSTVSEHTPQNFTLQWSPADKPVNVEIIKSGKLNAYEMTLLGSGANCDDEESIKNATRYNNGSRQITVCPEAFGSNESGQQTQRNMTIIYSVGEDENRVSASITLTQGVFNNMELTYDSDVNYGTTPCTVNVKSDFNWQVKDITESTGRGNIIDIETDSYLYDLLDSGSSVVANATKGVNISFNVRNSQSIQEGTVTITFADANNPNRYKVASFIVRPIIIHLSSNKGWAGSNIYWDGSKLTFADTGTTDKQYYQGLYFRYGSLVGLSPVGDWSTSSIMYAPTEWSGKETINTTGKEWTDIPYVTISPSEFAQTRQYLLEIHDPVNGIGDICKYITDKGWAPGSDETPRVKWRMPTSTEFGEASDYTSNGTASSITSTSATGQHKVSNFYLKRTVDSGNTPSSILPTHPASGYRDYNTGRLKDTGHGGYCWSASPYDTTFSYNLRFDGYGFIISPSDHLRLCGLSVRCVRE